MKYYYVEPEVAGGLGEATEMDRSVHPPVVTRLHIRFDGWLGDSLLETFPCFILVASAKSQLTSNGLTGAEFGSVEVSTSQLFRELYPNRTLPEFVWLRVHGKPGKDDFGVVEDGRLVISARAVEALKGGITHALLSDFGVV